MDEAGQNLLGHFPAQMVQQLEGLAGEVDDVPRVDVDMVGGGGEDHLGDVVAGEAEPDGGHEAAFSALVVADVDEVAEPALEDLGAGLAGGQRVDLESWSLASALAGDVAQALVQGARTVVVVELGQDVGGTGEDAHGRAPAAGRVGGAEA